MVEIEHVEVGIERDMFEIRLGRVDVSKASIVTMGHEMPGGSNALSEIKETPGHEIHNAASVGWIPCLSIPEPSCEVAMPEKEGERSERVCLGCNTSREDHVS